LNDTTASTADQLGTDVIDRVRALDAECNLENVARFFREIDAAAAALQRINASKLPLSTAFDPRWPRDSQR